VSTPDKAKSQRPRRSNVIPFDFQALRHRSCIRSCATCAHYAPRINWLFHKTSIELSRKPPFIRLRWLPNADSHHHAVCLMSGDFASVERAFGCEDGADWEPKSVPHD
jgi:hypothetical protein